MAPVQMPHRSALRKHGMRSIENRNERGSAVADAAGADGGGGGDNEEEDGEDILDSTGGTDTLKRLSSLLDSASCCKQCVLQNTNYLEKN